MLSNFTISNNSIKYVSKKQSYVNIIHMTLGTLIVLINVPVLRVYIQHRLLRTHVRNYFLISSFSVNILIGILLIMYAISDKLGIYSNKCELLFRSIFLMFVYQEITNLNIAVERLFAIKYRYRYNKLFTKLNICLYITAIKLILLMILLIRFVLFIYLFI